jgi:hypothetical protein
MGAPLEKPAKTALSIARFLSSSTFFATRVFFRDKIKLFVTKYVTKSAFRDKKRDKAMFSCQV